jgi:hypothetical protein
VLEPIGSKPAPELNDADPLQSISPVKTNDELKADPIDWSWVHVAI